MEANKDKIEREAGKHLILNGFDPIKYVYNVQKQDLKPYMRIYSSKVVQDIIQS